MIGNRDALEQRALEGNQTSSGTKYILAITYNCKKSILSYQPTLLNYPMR